MSDSVDTFDPKHPPAAMSKAEQEGRAEAKRIEGIWEHGPNAADAAHDALQALHQDCLVTMDNASSGDNPNGRKLSPEALERAVQRLFGDFDPGNNPIMPSLASEYMIEDMAAKHPGMSEPELNSIDLRLDQLTLPKDTKLSPGEAAFEAKMLEWVTEYWEAAYFDGRAMPDTRFILAGSLTLRRTNFLNLLNSQEDTREMLGKPPEVQHKRTLWDWLKSFYKSALADDDS